MQQQQQQQQQAVLEFSSKLEVSNKIWPLLGERAYIPELALEHK
jgi:hypothetical protein